MLALLILLALPLPPCPTEDSDSCIWRADLQGNGRGLSFVALPGGFAIPLNLTEGN